MPVESSSDRPSVSVVLPVRNGAATIALQLDALRDQCGECDEILVVDNGSTDGTLSIVAEFGPTIPNLRVVDAGEQPGLASVRNAGAAAAAGDLLVWCDADDIVAPGWVAAMVAALERHDLVGGRIDETTLNGPHAVARTDQAEHLPRPWGFLPFASGANMGIRRTTIDLVGGWNAEYALAGEDVDVCWRAQLAGATIGFVPEAVVYYRHRSTAAAVRRQQYRYGRTSATLHRHYRALGLRRGRASGLLRTWGKLTLLLPQTLDSPVSRRQWQGQLGYAMGTTVGAVAERAWPY